jgi:catechol 2,3-dioxygenase-like lactoylglutathione lyase family enzyme
MQLAYARIVTTNVQSLARFYEQITGLTVIGDDQFAVLKTLRGELAISSGEGSDLHGGGAAPARSNRSIVLDFEVADVDAERVRLETLALEFVMAPTNQPWGNRSLLFRDLDGNLINFYTPLTNRKRGVANHVMNGRGGVLPTQIRNRSSDGSPDEN